MLWHCRRAYSCWYSFPDPNLVTQVRLFVRHKTGPCPLAALRVLKSIFIYLPKNLAQVRSCRAWLVKFRAGSFLKLKFYRALAVRAICRHAKLHQCCWHPLPPALSAVAGIPQLRSAPELGNHQQELLPLFAFSFTPAHPCWPCPLDFMPRVLCSQVYDDYLCQVSVVGAFISPADNRYKPFLKYTCECRANKNPVILRRKHLLEENSKERDKLIWK